MTDETTGTGTMIASGLIIVFSVVLFLYWFRYTCLLILSTKTTTDYAGQVARANQLRFMDVQEKLREQLRTEALDSLRQSLDRDFRLITYLIRHGSPLEAGNGLEQRMLMINYSVMKAWYSVTRSMAASHAQSALREMSDIVGHFANAMGERAAATSQI